MQISMTERLLYIMATIADHNRACFSLNVGLTPPGSPSRFKYRNWFIKSLKNKKSKHKIFQTIYRLKKSKLIEEKIFNKSRGYMLTPNGFMKFYKSNLTLKGKKKYKNGQYLMVFFDIPEKKKKVRDNLRSLLRELGFEKIQQSVWATPYQVIDELQDFISDCQLNTYVKPLIVKEIPK